MSKIFHPFTKGISSLIHSASPIYSLKRSPGFFSNVSPLINMSYLKFHSAKPCFSFSANSNNNQHHQAAKEAQKHAQGSTQIDDSLKLEQELIFAKVKKTPPEQIFNPEIQIQEFEKKVKATNLNVLKRELFNDSMQLPIKFLAYTLAGPASVGTFLAEFSRSSIDAVNHLMLFLANYIDVTPNDQYPKGTENIKYLVILVPSLLFLFFGGYTIYSSFADFFAATAPVHSESESLYSILLYLASFGIEISVIAYNIRDSIKMQGLGDKQSDKKQSLFEMIKGLYQKKDPLLQAVLYENMITLLSMSVPLLVGLSNSIYPSNIPELVGQNIIGFIQLICGYKLGKETTQTLLGRSVDAEIMKEIHSEILKNPYVKTIKSERGTMSGSVRFKYSAVVEYDFEELMEEVTEDYKQTSDYIIYSRDYKDRQDELEELMENFPLRLMKEIKKQEQSICESIQRLYPQCDIKIERFQLSAVVDEEEKIENSFHKEIESDDEMKEETEEEKHIKEWVLDTSSTILAKNYAKKNIQKIRSQDSLYYEYIPFRQNPKHYSNSLHQVYIQEKAIIFEDERHEILMDIVHGDSSNYPEDFPDNHKQN